MVWWLRNVNNPMFLIINFDLDFCGWFIRNRWKLILCMESVFFVVFFIGIIFKYANPDLWHPFRGGEKPMDLAYFTAVIRSPFMPPYDPWYAQGQMNYYYWMLLHYHWVLKLLEE